MYTTDVVDVKAPQVDERQADLKCSMLWMLLDVINLLSE